MASPICQVNKEQGLKFTVTLKILGTSTLNGCVLSTAPRLSATLPVAETLLADHEAH